VINVDKDETAEEERVIVFVTEGVYVGDPGVRVAVGQDDVDGHPEVERLRVFVTEGVYVGDPGVRVAVGQDDVDGHPELERLRVFVTEDVYVGDPGVIVPVPAGETDDDTLGVQVRVPGVLVPDENPEEEIETVLVYVGVPGVRVPVAASEIVLDTVYCGVDDILNETVTDGLTVYDGVPGVIVLVAIPERDPEDDPLDEFNGVSVGIGGRGIDTDGDPEIEDDTLFEDDNDAIILGLAKDDGDSEVFTLFVRVIVSELIELKELYEGLGLEVRRLLEVIETVDKSEFNGVPVI